MTRPRIGDQVVVLTGASSGIGRETALELARRGPSPRMRPIALPTRQFFEPVDEPPSSYGSHPPHFRRSLYTQVAVRRGLMLALASLGALGIVGLWQARK